MPSAAVLASQRRKREKECQEDPSTCPQPVQYQPMTRADVEELHDNLQFAFYGAITTAVAVLILGVLTIVLLERRIRRRYRDDLPD